MQKSFMQANIKNILLALMAIKLVYVDDKFSKTYLGQKGIYSFINSMIKESNSAVK